MSKILKILLLLALTACANHAKFHGYPDPEKIPTIINKGDTKSQVRDKIGTPSAMSNDQKTWYYIRINGKEGAMVSFIPSERIVTSIEFGYTDKVSKISMQKAPLSPSDRTPLKEIQTTRY